MPDLTSKTDRNGTSCQSNELGARNFLYPWVWPVVDKRPILGFVPWHPSAKSVNFM